ncbi:TlpA disulfide reductase family protein [Chitinophaga sp. GbtcB8]|uniref:TlpA family protein disulfide reductase n=1 Tax=Chitinophaga sp. GbtcB8 TaxID=2824753 RepID=UPI001C3113E0|nr:TlpA disulfide reductase family protein [Chitinophaga sp. GbtcB8]
MKLSRNLLTSTIVFFLLLQQAFAFKGENPVIGKPCPQFTLKNIKYYHKKEASLKDFKGKWLLLDFWNKNCVVCVKTFPKTNSLRKQFKDSVDFILVGRQDKENEIEQLFEKFRSKMNLDLPCSFDSSLVKQWEYYANPVVVVIDPDGIVRALTTSIDSTSLRRLMHGESVNLYGIEEKKYDESIPFLVNNNGAPDSVFLYRSLISVWTTSTPYYNMPIKLSLQTGKLEELGISLQKLYNLAYIGDTYWSFTPSYPWQDTLYGNYCLEPIVEVTDKSNFEADRNTGRRKLFCYSQVFPKGNATELSVRSTIQKDLQSCFGYNVTIKTKKMPYWRLTFLKEEYKDSLRAKRGPQSVSQTHAQFKGKNIPISSLLGQIAFKNEPNIAPFIDETGVDFNIDIELNCIFTDINDVKSSLLKKGLLLEKSEKEMKVLVISNN